jgi:glycolate oxidase
MFDEAKVKFLRRDDEAWIPLPEWVNSAVATICYGTSAELEAVKSIIFDIGAAHGGVYMGQEISEGDWASRHDRYHLAYHGRSDGTIRLMSWSCEDAAITWSQLPTVKRRWYAIAEALVAKHPEHFDIWGMFMYTGNPFRPWGDFLTEIDIGVNELEMTPEIWADWVAAKTQIARVSVECGGSVSAAHGGTREGEVDVACYEELKDGQFDLMKRIKKMLDPNNIMNPGKYHLDEAYTQEETT